jgi:CSLREA domain-containing protein
VVTSTADDGSVGTLRYGITTGVCDGGTITFDPVAFASPGPYTINLSNANGELLVNKNVTITGPGASVLTVKRDSAATNKFRVFEIAAGKTVQISGMTISNGSVVGTDGAAGSGAVGGSVFGGGISNAGTLTLTNVIVSGNSATGGAGGSSATTPGNGGNASGGGIYNNGTLTLSNSTVASNTSTGGAGGANTGAGSPGNAGNGLGGGIYNDASASAAITAISGSTINSNTASVKGGGIYNTGTLTNAALALTNSTVSGNNANNDGGGIYNDGATGTTVLTSVTVTNNRADNDNNGSGNGGGIKVVTGTVTLKNTIVAGNFNEDGVTDTADDINGAVAGSFNLIGDGTGMTGIANATNNNQVGVADARLDALASNGGPTQTHALLTSGPASPAIDAGSDVLTTLSADITDTTSPKTITVADTSSIPAGVGFVIRIDAEQMVVTSKTSTTLTVTRGANGTTAATHLSNGGTTPVSLTTDQRGLPRPAGSAADIGAFETQPTPSAPGTPNLNDASDSGTNNQDNKTNITTNLSFTITPVTPGATVELFRDGNPIGTGVTGVAAGNSIQLVDPGTGLIFDNDGTDYVYTAKQSVGSGNTSPASTGLTVTITIVPDKPVLDPASDSGTPGDNITNDTSPTFNITNVVNGATVELLRDGNPIGAGVTGVAAGTTIQLTDPSAPEGTYSYSARQTFNSVTSVPSASQSVQITIKPNAPVLVAASDSGTVGDGITNDDSPTFSVTGIVVGAKVELFRDNGATAVDTIASAASTTVQLTDPGPVSEALHSYKVRQTVGITVSPDSDPTGVTIDKTIAPATPDLTDASDTGASTSDNRTGAPSRDFNISTTENGSTVVLLRRLATDPPGSESPVAGVNASKPGTGSSITLTDANVIPDGTYQYSTRETDKAGNVGTSSTLAVTIDTTPPSVASVVRASANPTAAGSVDFTVTFSEPVQVSGVDASDFAVTKTGGITGESINPAIVAVAPSGSPSVATQFTVTVNTGTGDGTLRLDVVDIDDSILDIMNLPLGGTNPGNGNFSAGQVYTISKSNPFVSSINRANPDPTNLATINFTVTFNKAVTGVDSGDFKIVASVGIAGAGFPVNPITTSDNIHYNVAVNTGSGDGTIGLNLDDDNSIVDSSNRPLGGAAAGDGNFTMGQVYTVDKTKPDVTVTGQADVTGPKATTVINFTVTFTEPVVGFSSSELTLSGTATGGGTVAEVSETGLLDRKTYNVAVKNMTGSGTVILSVGANKLTDDAGNFNNASTSPVDPNTDNTVNFTKDDFTTLVVNTIADTDDTSCDPLGTGTGNKDCTLREAINAANGDAGAEIITFDSTVFASPGPYTINLGSVLPDLSSSMTINGPGANVLLVKRNVSARFRIFTVTSGVTVNISGLTVTNGFTADGPTGLKADDGGGIFNAGTLTLTNVAVSGNKTGKGGDGSGGPGGPGGAGGGIYNDTGATLTVTNSTIGGTPGVDGNKTGNGGNATNPNNNGVGGDGGGIFNAGTLNLTNSTISGNQTGAAGTGGLGNAGGGGGGILNINSPLTISNSTITANTVGNGRGGGLRQAGSGVITIKSTIVGGNSATVGPDIDGTVQSDGFNLVQSTSGATINQNGGAGPNITGQDAQLNALADNGGPTKTHSLQCVSPAIDKGFNFGQTTDQRGLVRVFDFADSIYPNAASPGNGTDIGAYESQAGGGCIPDAIAPNPQPTTNEDTQKTITLTGQFSQNTTLVLTVTQQPSHGSLSNQSAPTCNFANNTNTCTATVNYTPALNYSGPDTFKFKASAGALDSAEADVNITVNAVNDPPVAFDNFSPVTNEDTPINITLFGSDVDTPAANLVFTVVTGPSHGTLSGTAPNLTYTPAADYFGGDSFTFKINDGQLDSNVATVGITVTAVNDRPQATSQVVSTNENTPKVITLTGIDVDTPPSNFGFIIVSGPSHGTLSPGTPNAVQTYTPNQNYNGPDSFTFKINDGQLESNSATVTINVIAVNDAPVANAQAVSTNEDTPLGITLTGTDTETPSSSLTFNVTQQPAHGTLTGTGPNRTYTPAADYNGPDSFKFTVTDTGDGSAAPLTSGEAVVSITVGAVNDAPINTVPGAQSVIENGTLTFSSVNLNPISTSDVDAGASSVMVTLTATNGKVTLSGTTGLNFITGTGTANAIMTFTGPITSVNTALNGLVFTPNQGFDGAASLQIVTNDQGNTGSGGPLADTDTINIAVLDGGALAFSSATYTVSETGGTATITVNRTGGTNGTATVNYATSNGTATAGQDYTAASGTLTFGPGVTTQTFTVPITNDNLTEGAETVNLTLSSIGGSGALGTPSTAILTITETAPLGPLVQLSSATYDVNEGAGRATITVNRSGDISQAASVHYATSDLAGLTPCATANGLASERCDYATVVGTLSFAANQSSKTILIPIVNDSYAEGPETFTITLSNFTGASAGAITSATITILDNDAVTGPNPIDTNQEFIQALYRDFLGREPDPPGLQGWLNTLNNCPAGSTSCDRVEVASGFARSEEFATRGYFIYRLYEGILGRMPQYNEFTVDMAGVSGFLSSQELETAKQAAIEALMQRPEFKTRYDSTLNDPAGFVNLLEQAARVTLPNKQALIADLQAGRKTRAQVIRAVIETSEVFNKYFNEALVVMNYFGFLRRSPDALFQHWLDLMNSTGDIRQVINGFVNSAEYRLRFGP